MVKLIFFLALSSVVITLVLTWKLLKPTPSVDFTEGSIDISERMFPGYFRMPGIDFTLPYRLFIPQEYSTEKKYPLILYLHPTGRNGDDNIRQLLPEVGIMTGSLQEIEPVFILAPQSIREDKWVKGSTGAPNLNYSQEERESSDALRLSEQLVLTLQQHFSIDENRIYVTGASAGGTGTWDLISRQENHIFAAAIPITGANDPTRANKISSMPIWAFHGSDDTTSPVTNTREMVERLRSLESPVKYSELENVGHNSWERAYEDMETFRWLLSQNRSEWDSL